MKRSYRGRMIGYNMSIFLAVFGLIYFCVIQSLLYYQIDAGKKAMTAAVNDTLLKLQEDFPFGSEANSFDTDYAKKAPDLAKTIAEWDGMDTFLFDRQGTLLGSTTAVTETFFNKQLTGAVNSGHPVSMLVDTNHQDRLTYVSPLKINDTISGYVGFILPLDGLNRHFRLISLLTGIIGLLFIGIQSHFFAKDFVQPVEDLTAIALEINEGNYNARIFYRQDDEIGRLTAAFNQMITNTNSVINQLESERKRLAGVLASLDDGLLALDGKGNVITSNAYIRTYFNVINPKTIYDFQFQSFLRDIFFDLKNGKSYISLEVDCNDRDLMIIGSPMTEAGFEENYMIVIRNMTAANRIKKDQQKFISSVSHELRTPLTTIIGYTDMILRRQLTDNPMINGSLSTINQEGHRLLRLVNDLLSVNKLDTPEFSIKKMTLNLMPLLTEVIEQMKIQSLEKDIDILLKGDPILPEILGDYDRLRQVFINIIHNAIKYSHEGDIIDVIVTVDEEWISISVRDYGTGMAAKELDRVFSAFYRVEEDRARSADEGGAGLGLYLVRQILTRHQGSVDIKSVPDEGTIVTVKLPVVTKIIQEGIADEN